MKGALIKLCSEKSNVTPVYASNWERQAERHAMPEPCMFVCRAKTGVTTHPEQIRSTSNAESLGSTILRCDAHSTP